MMLGDDFPEKDFGWIDRGDDLVTTRTAQGNVRYDKAHQKAIYINGLKKQALTDLITALPAPDTVIYILSNGSGGTFKANKNPQAFEFGHFIPVLAQFLGGQAITCYVSTWTMNRWHCLQMLQMLDESVLASLAVMTDPYFLQRESVVANTLVEGLMQRQQRFKAFKNHVKAVAMQNAAGDSVSILASANLSAQPRAENYTLSTDPGLYAFLVNDFFEVMLNA